MKNLKNQKGITLVALVVTIIVLLILAGVSLSLVAGSNGIMTRTVNARDKNESATAAERAELAIAELQMEWYEAYYANGDKTGNYATLQQYLTSKTGKEIGGYKLKITNTNVEVSTTKDGVLAKADLVYQDANNNADLNKVAIKSWTLVKPGTEAATE